MLVFRRGGKEMGRIAGEGRRLDLLQEIVGTRTADDAVKLLLPKDMDGFDGAAAALTAEVRSLLTEGREKVERVERLVCALYGLDADLTDAVVEHAVARAKRSMSPDV